MLGIGRGNIGQLCLALSQTVTTRSIGSCMTAATSFGCRPSVGKCANLRASRALSATLGCGLMPADIARTYSPRSALRIASAICERQEFPVHSTSTVLRAVMVDSRNQPQRLDAARSVRVGPQQAAVAVDANLVSSPKTGMLTSV